jgi:hypothetical protein
MKILNLILSIVFWITTLIMLSNNNYQVAIIQMLLAISFGLGYYYEDLKDQIKGND